MNRAFIKGLELSELFYKEAVKMYEREGFQTVARLGKNTVFMRLII